MRAFIGVAASPAGDLLFAVNDGGEVIHTRFREGDYPDTATEYLEGRGYVLEEDGVRTAAFAEEIEEYAAGERRNFDVAISPSGTEWQLEVWDALVGIPFGETRTYSEIASRVGRPGAARAAGRANATNRIPLVVPCHRVVGANGKLTGFAGGVHLKERLLDHERKVSLGRGAV